MKNKGICFIWISYTTFVTNELHLATSHFGDEEHTESPGNVTTHDSLGEDIAIICSKSLV